MASQPQIHLAVGAIIHGSGSPEEKIHDGKRLVRHLCVLGDFQGLEYVAKFIGISEVREYAITKFNEWMASEIDILVGQGNYILLERIASSSIASDDNRRIALSRRDEAIANAIEYKKLEVDLLIQNGQMATVDSTGLISELAGLSKDMTTTEANRVEVGKILIGIAYEYGGYQKLLRMKIDGSTPETVKQIAAQLVAETALRSVEVCFNNGSDDGLQAVVSDKRLELTVREQAARKMVGLYVRSGFEWVLDEISIDHSWPKFVRDMAARQWAQIVRDKKFPAPANQATAPTGTKRTV